MSSMSEIEQAVRDLSRADRRRLLDWLAGALDWEMGVSEPMARTGSARKQELFSLDEYFDIEAKSSILHEYVAGEIYDMADPSQAHDLIAMNLAAPLHAHVQDRPCRVYFGRRQLQFKIGKDDFVYRPDVWVACGDVRTAKGEYVDAPCLVIEVLSPSTARYDRREKVTSYGGIPSVEEYVVVAQKPTQIVIHRRAEQWEPQVLASPDDVLELRSVGLAVPVARIYKGVCPETLP